MQKNFGSKLGLCILLIGLSFILSATVFGQENAPEEPEEAVPAPDEEADVPQPPASAPEAEVKNKAETVEVSPAAVAKTMPNYKLNLKQMIDAAQRNIKKIQKEIEETEAFKRNNAREAEAQEHFAKGNRLYEEGNLQGAKQEWEEALKISKDQRMKGYIQQAEAKARKQEIAQQKQAKEEARRLAEQKRQEKLAQRQAELKAKEEQARIEKQRKEAQRAQAEAKRQEEIARRQAKQQEKEKQVQLLKEQKAARERAQIEALRQAERKAEAAEEQEEEEEQKEEEEEDLE